MMHILERLFHLQERKTSVRTEILAGTTTYLAMAYIILVNPAILAEAGFPHDAVLSATIWTAAAASAIMGLWANFPVAVAPGMGLNVFMASYMCGELGLHWTTALGATFISGTLFLILTLTHLRQRLMAAIPANLKIAVVAGIGLFIAFIGLQSAGIVVIRPDHPFPSLGNMLSAEPLLACFGLLLTVALLERKVPGSLLVGILATTVLALICGVTTLPSSLEYVPFPDITPTLGKLDIRGALDYGLATLVFALTAVELFDSMGSLIGLSRKARLMDDQGHIENLDRALTADSIGILIGSTLGTSMITCYMESATGIAQGGRTGLTALTVSLLFVASLPLAPLVAIVPPCATSLALILVGVFMAAEAAHIDASDMTESFPAVLTMLMTPFTYNIATGFGFGFISYAALKALTGRAREVPPVLWLIAGAFLVNFALRSHGATP